MIELVDEIARALPLERLDGITIGGDYPALLRAVDRGWDGAPVPETVPAEIGTGIAQVVTVKRRGMIKGRIVASSIVSSALISEDLEERGWGTHAFVKQLAHVALMEILEKQLPGTLLEPTDDGIDGWLYANVGGAPESYAASWMAAGFGFPEVIAAGYRDLLAVAFEWMMTKVPEERLAYREHGDLDRLLNVALPAIRHVLMVAANLHGHCAFSGSLPLGESGSLCDALEDAGAVGVVWRLWRRSGSIPPAIRPMDVLRGVPRFRHSRGASTAGAGYVRLGESGRIAGRSTVGHRRRSPGGEDAGGVAGFRRTGDRAISTQ